MFEVVIPLVLLANGLAAGVLVGTQLGGMPLLEALPPARYVHAHAFFSTRFDPFMPACLVATVLGDIVLGIVAGTAQVLFFAAAVCALASMVISLVKNVPVNKWIRTLDPASLPGDFAERDPRRTWGGWNRTRTYLVVLAMAANCVAVGIALANQN